MKIFIKQFLLIAFLLVPLHAEVITVSPEYEQRYSQLLHELRCLVCQNQTVAESSSELANDLRIEVKEMMEHGATNQEILNFMSDRYGDFVLYKPPVKPRTLLLWLGPYLLLIGGVVIVVLMISKRAKITNSSALSEQDEQRIKELLEKDKKDKD